jgi:hypothetical protein
MRVTRHASAPHRRGYHVTQIRQTSSRAHVDTPDDGLFWMEWSEAVNYFWSFTECKLDAGGERTPPPVSDAKRQARQAKQQNSRFDRVRMCMCMCMCMCMWAYERDTCVSYLVDVISVTVGGVARCSCHPSSRIKIDKGQNKSSEVSPSPCLHAFLPLLWPPRGPQPYPYPNIPSVSWPISFWLMSEPLTLSTCLQDATNGNGYAEDRVDVT